MDLEETLRAICAKHKIHLKVHGATLDDDSVLYAAQPKFNDIPVKLQLDVSESRGPLYRTYVFPANLDAVVPFLDVRLRESYDAQIALSHFVELLDACAANAVSDSLLPEYGVWERNRVCSSPKCFEGQIPLMGVAARHGRRERYNIKLTVDEILNVDGQFSYRATYTDLWTTQTLSCSARGVTYSSEQVTHPHLVFPNRQTTIANRMSLSEVRTTSFDGLQKHCDAFGELECADVVVAAIKSL